MFMSNSDSFKYECPHCNQIQDVSYELNGQTGNCPTCNEEIVLEDIDYTEGTCKATCTKDFEHNYHKNEATKNAIYTMIGVQDTLEVFDDNVTISPKGVLGFLNKGLKGKKEIPFSSIIAVQFKEAGSVFSGYIQFTISGGNESKGGLFAATTDENTFMFAHKKNNELAIKIKEYITSAVRNMHKPQVAQTSTINLSDELKKLAELKEQGILTEEEFIASKNKLLG